MSLFALQFAKAMGARVVATSSSDDKLAKLEALGADYLVNYRDNPDWDKKVLALTGGVDAVIDVGGQATLPQSIHCAKTDGFIDLDVITGLYTATTQDAA